MLQREAFILPISKAVVYTDSKEGKLPKNGRTKIRETNVETSGGKPAD